MASEAEQVELLVSSDTTNHADAAVLAHSSMHHGHNLNDFDVKYSRKSDEGGTSTMSCCESIGSPGRQQVVSFVERHVPAVRLIRTYKFRQDILGDIISGLSVGVMTIPQSMGYSLLASMPPKFGLYTSVFPVLVYFIFGTSRHVSLGTMALNSLIIHSVVTRDTSGLSLMNVTGNGTTQLEEEHESAKVMIAMSVSMTAGLILFVMSLFQLGFVVTYMSESFISGYIAAANILVLTHQLKLILGIKVQSHGSALEWFFLVYEICRNIADTNLMQLLISVVSVAVLVLVKKCINERFRSRLKVPIPVDLIVVIIATIISYFADLHGNFDVKIVNEIPYGIPAPVVPSMKMMYAYWFEGFMLAIISYLMVAMMAVLFAQRHDYSVDNNQELAANGLACIVGAFFNSLAASTSPPRCFLMESTGGKTQVSYVVSALLVLVTVYAIAPLFEALPLCVLASIVVVACIPLFVHYTMWMTYWRTDHYDLAIWIVSFFGTFITGVDYGMLVGVAFSVIVVHFRMQHSKSSKLAVSVDDFLFLDAAHYDKVSSLQGTAMFRFSSPIYFATLSVFKQQLFTSTVSVSELKARKRRAEKLKKVSVDGGTGADDAGKVVRNADQLKNQPDDGAGLNGELLSEPVDAKDVDDVKQNDASDIQNIILECSGVAFVDTSGCRLLALLHGEYDKHGVRLVLAGCCEDVVSSLKRVDQCQMLCKDALYPNIHSAVLSLCHSLYQEG